MEKLEKKEKKKKIKPASQHSKVRKSASQQASKPASQQGRKPAIQQANRPFCTGLSSGNQVDGLPLGLHKDAVSASCILPGRAPNRTISQKIDAVEIFKLENRL